jgi:uncharacterized protein (DUF433 family)
VLGQGLYTPRDASRLLAIPPSTLRRWLRGYTFRLVSDQQRHAGPVIDSMPNGEVINFLDLTELLMVKGFRSARVTLPNIRVAAETAARLLGVPHPLAFQGLKTDGRHIFADLQRQPGFQGLVNLGRRGQAAFPDVVEAYLRGLDYDVEPGFATRWWPRGRHRIVVVDSRVNFGAPHIDGTGIPTRAVFEAVSAGEPPSVIADWFRLRPNQVDEAVDYEKELQAA